MQLIGVNECTKRINDLILRAKEAAGIDPKTQLKCIVSGHLFWALCALLLLECSVSVLPLSSCQGLSLSGADQKEAQEKISSELLANFPALSEDYHICTDTYGSLATALPRGVRRAECVCGCMCVGVGVGVGVWVGGCEVGGWVGGL